MKFKLMAALMAGGLATSMYGQGILMNNLANSGGVTATAGGRVFTNTVTGTTVGAGIFDGANFNIGAIITGGPDAGTQAGLGQSGTGIYTASTDIKGYTGEAAGQFRLGNASVAVPGVAAGGVATIVLKAWYDGAGGLFPSFAAASAGGGKVGTVTWGNPTGNAGGSPPTPDQSFTSMPSFILAPVPEPSTMVLTGLGVGALWLLRRRK